METVKLLKFWNVRNGRVYTSYELEKYVIDRNYFLCYSLMDYFFSAVEGLPTYSLPEYKRTKVDKLKSTVKTAKEYLTLGMPINAELTVKGIFE